MNRNLLIADLAHALNQEDDATVKVAEVFYGSFLVADEPGSLRSAPGFTAIFEKDGQHYVALFTLYSASELKPFEPTEEPTG